MNTFNPRVEAKNFTENKKYYLKALIYLDKPWWLGATLPNFEGLNLFSPIHWVASEISVLCFLRTYDAI